MARAVESPLHLVPARPVWREYVALAKPRVVALMLLTVVVGMLLSVPGPVPWPVLLLAPVGIGLVAGSAAAVNHLVDRRIDALMVRTRARPLPRGALSVPQVATFALALGAAGLAVLLGVANVLCALLTLASLLGYAVIYSMFLKHATPQNIVIGGAAGAAPPLLGWVAVTGQVDPQALLLFLIVFVWTPPHFWALAIHRREEYARAAVPMLPVTHGIAFAARCVLLYTWLLFGVSLLPYAIGMSGGVYLMAAVALGARFLALAWKLQRDDRLAMPTFRFSIIYLGLLFAALLFDHYLG